MRATISFEADVSRVNDIMRSLVLEESNALQDALMSLENATSERIVEGISDALGHIYGVASQLEQYRQMMAGFEKARFESLSPSASEPSVRPTDPSKSQEAMSMFQDFLGRINEEEEDESDTEEG